MSIIQIPEVDDLVEVVREFISDNRLVLAGVTGRVRLISMSQIRVVITSGAHVNHVAIIDALEGDGADIYDVLRLFSQKFRITGHDDQPELTEEQRRAVLLCPACGNCDPQLFEYQEDILSYRKVQGVEDDTVFITGHYDVFDEGSSDYKDARFVCQSPRKACGAPIGVCGGRIDAGDVEHDFV